MSPSSWYYVKLIAFSGFSIIPLLAPTGHYAGLPWLSPFFIFVLIPGLDLLFASDRTGPLERPVPRVARLWLYLVPHICVVAWLGVLLWAAMLLPALSSPLERLSLLVAVATASAFATCAGHELVHRPGRLDRFMSRLTPGVPYQDLRHMGDMPLLPAGYFALFFPALVPPLWHAIMDAPTSEAVDVLKTQHIC